jgi:hypothetical protein
MPGLLTGLLGAATQAATGYGNGERQAQDKNTALAMLLAQRAEEQRVNDARIADYTASAARANQPAKVPRDPVSDHEAIRRFDILHPLPTRAGSGTARDPMLTAAVSSTARQQSLAAARANAAQSAMTKQFPTGEPEHVDPTIAASPGYFGSRFGATPAKPNPDYPKYKSDSTAFASASDRVKRALATSDSLNAVAEKLSSRLTNEATDGADLGGDDEGDDSGTPTPAPRAPAAPAAPATAAHLPEAASAFKQAADALQAAGGPSNAQARAQYNRVVAGIASHFQLTAPGSAPGSTPASDTPPTPDE